MIRRQALRFLTKLVPCSLVVFLLMSLVCIQVFATDAYESNNTFGTAYSLSSNTTINATINISGDIDYYKFTISSASSCTIRMTPPSDKDYDLYLYDSAQTQIGSSVLGTGSIDTITQSLNSGTYYVKVIGYNGAYSSSTYSLSISSTASSTTNVSVSVVKVWIPQNKDAISVPKFKISDTTGTYQTTSGGYILNVCYDYSSSYRPYSGWGAIDYSNTSGKAELADKVLRQAEVRVRVTNSSGTAISGKTVTLSSSLGTLGYIKNPSATTDANGYATGYIEFYGNRTFNITATVDGTSTTLSNYAATVGEYRNRFLMTVYNFALRSRCSSWDAFVSDVRMQGTGKDDTVSPNKWYRYNPNGPGILEVAESSVSTATGTFPTENRTMAVDSPYITRKYLSGSYYRGKVKIDGAVNTSGDSGYRTAEDSGGAINGYHIDVFIGFKTPSEFTSQHPNIYVESGKHFPKLWYDKTLQGGTLQ